MNPQNKCSIINGFVISLNKNYDQFTKSNCLCYVAQIFTTKLQRKQKIIGD